MSTESTVPVFVYGGLMNPAMQARVDVRLTARAEATLVGYELTISPWVNLQQAARGVVYGVVLWLTHADLERLYAQLKARYLPIAVNVTRNEGGSLPALCYVSMDMPAGRAEEGHVRMLLEPAAQLGFPEWYLARIRSFLP